MWPRSIITDNLSQLRGKAKSKKISRLCSSWARTENKERITVHAYVGGSGAKTLNAAYTSQTCPNPTCGYVSLDNRSGDVFHCSNPYWDCNWQGDVDHVAAMNIASRIGDHQIDRFTPYTEVKKILDARFLRRLESRNIPVDTKASAQRLRLQGYHDNPSWTWEVCNHRLALVLSPWMGQNTQRRLESENKRGAYECICISERHNLAYSERNALKRYSRMDRCYSSVI